MKQMWFLLRVLLFFIINRLEMFLLLMIHRTPWYKAFIISVWTKYKESELFRQRWIAFSREIAAEMYSYKEHKLFAHYVKQDKKLILRILFTPYSILNEITEDDCMIRSHVVLK